MTERVIYDNKYLVGQGPTSGALGNMIMNNANQGGSSLNRGSNLIANKVSSQRFIQQHDQQQQISQKIRLHTNNSAQKKINITNQNGLSRNDKNQIAHSNSYSQNDNLMMLNHNVLNNFSSRTAKGALLQNAMMSAGQATVQIASGANAGTATNPLSYFNENSNVNNNNNNNNSSKKTRRLRKNFDLLSQAMKNTNTVKREKKINFSSENNRQYHNQSQNIPQMYQHQNFIQESNSPSVFSQVQMQNKASNGGGSESIAQLYQYGAHIQGPLKDRKNSCFDVILGGGGNPAHYNSTGPSHKSQGSAIAQQHNNSLYSQISIKDTPSKSHSNHNFSSQNQSRNPSMMIYQNIPNQTQPISMIHEQKFLKIKDKMMRRYVAPSGTTHETQHIIVPQGSHLLNNTNPLPNQLTSGTNSQAILNINTASDINIYNNSFIVNTTSKKQSQSQNQSRSNSLKRNQAKGQNNNNSKINNIHLQKYTNINTATMNLQNILAQQAHHQHDYQGRSNSQQNQQRSQQRLSATGFSANGDAHQHAKFNQIAEAYTTQSFFSVKSQKISQRIHSNNNNNPHHSSQKSHSQAGMPSHNKSQSSQSTNPLSHQQPSYQNQVSYNNNKNHNHNQSSFDQLHPQLYSQSTDQEPQTTSSAIAIGSGSTNSISNFGKKGKLQQQQNKININSSSAGQQMHNKGKVSSSQSRSYGGNNLNHISQSSQKLDSESSPFISNDKSAKAKQQSQSLLNQGKKRLMDKDFQTAIKIFSDAMSLDSSNTDAKFYRGLSYIDSGMIQEGITELQEIINISPSHSQLAHILLSIAYKRSNDFSSSLNILNQCIQRHPDYSDAYLARGQALLLQEQFNQALKDFTQYSKLVPSNGIGYVGQADSLKSLKKWQEAIEEYTKGIKMLKEQTEGNHGDHRASGPQQENDDQARYHMYQAYLKRGLAYYQLKKYQQALPDLQQVIQNDKANIKAHFYIGKVLSRDFATTPRADTTQRQKIQSDAILHFEQVVKYHTNEVYTGNALFEIAKLRLQDKDFYEAYFNLKRAVDSNFNSKRLQLYKDFTEGVLYLIKRKIKKGVQILSDLLEVLVNSKEKKDKKQLDYLKHQSYIYRAYGYVAIEKYEIALQDIKKAKKIGKLDLSSIYNRLLGKGILKMDNEEYLMATKYFNKASMKFNQNKDPYCLYIISIVRSYSYSMANCTIDQEEKREKVLQAKEFMDRAIANCNKVKIPSLYFFRGLLYFQLHMFYEALKDFNVAIEEEEEPTASYYLARGRCYACLSILTEAMKDLSIALNLDDSVQEAYIYRGKCAYLLGDNNLAFLDFQRLILTDPKNPMVHVYAGNLLMTTGAYQDAIKAFLNADTVQKTAVAAFQRARCYCAMTDLENSKMQFKMALQLCKNDSLIQIDSQCLTALMRVINSNIDRANQSKNISSAIETINSLIEIFESGQIKSIKKKDSQLNIQIIPNVKRIKIEKVAVAKELFAQQSDQKDLSLSIDLNQTVDLDSLKNIPLYSYYYENVFSLEDFYLFRAVFYFYNKEYMKAIDDYETCQTLKIDSEKRNPKYSQNQTNDPESMIIFNQSQSSTPNLSMNSSKTDLSDVGLCSLNVHETNYNILLCYLMMNNTTKSLEKLNELIKNSPSKYSKYFYLIRGLIYEQTNQKDKFLKDIKRYEKSEHQSYDYFFKDSKDLVFEPFPFKNRLCSKFESVRLQLGIKRPSILTKPSFSMPFIKPPNMIPNIDEEAIQNEFTLKQIDAPMPEAPWIRRCSHGIKFTDNILQDEIDEMELGQEEKQQEGKSDSKKDPQKNSASKKKQNELTDQSPYTQSVEVNQKKNGQGLSEQILKNAMIYLVDQGEEQMSDKHKISLFDDSKFEDLTIELPQYKTKKKSTLLKDSLYDEAAAATVIQHGFTDNEDDLNQDIDDDSSSADEGGTQILYKPNERDSMVLVGESSTTAVPKKISKKYLDSQEGNQLMHKGPKKEGKRQIMSELQSNFDEEGEDGGMNEKDIQDRESIFRSRQSSKR